MTHNLSTIGLAWGLGWRLVPMTAGHRPPLYFSSVKKRWSLIAMTWPADLSYIFLFVPVKSNCRLHYHEKTSPPCILVCWVIMPVHRPIWTYGISVPVLFLLRLLASFFKKIYVSRLIDVFWIQNYWVTYMYTILLATGLESGWPVYIELYMVVNSFVLR
jgi:hypothetical protein